MICMEWRMQYVRKEVYNICKVGGIQYVRKEEYDMLGWGYILCKGGAYNR